VSPRGKRTKIDTGIYSDSIGFSICAKIHGQQFEKRTKALPDQALRQRWIEALTARMPTRLAGTLAGDIDVYLKTLPAKSARKVNATNDLQPWRERFGDQRRGDLTSIDIRTALAEWQSRGGPGSAPSTLNHRRQELLNLYTSFNGKAGANPVRDVPRVRDVREEPRGIPMQVARYILKFLEDTASKHRLTVLLETGLPHIQIARLQSRDFQEKPRTVFVRPRRKGAGVKGVTLPLTRRGAAAIAALFKAGAEGTFSNSSLRKAFLRALVKAQARFYRRHRRYIDLPPHFHAYDLRHAFGTEALKRTRDIHATAELMLHADIRTTLRYTEAAVSENARKAIDLMDQD
jgi:integrase